MHCILASYRPLKSLLLLLLLSGLCLSQQTKGLSHLATWPALTINPWVWFNSRLADTAVGQQVHSLPEITICRFKTCMQ